MPSRLRWLVVLWTTTTRGAAAWGDASTHRPRIPVLAYRDDWVAVSKPAGLSTHRSAQTPRAARVVATSLKRQLARKVWPVHRLDHRTSGALLFAFDAATCAELQGMLARGRKEYVALVRGEWTGERRRIIDAPLRVDGTYRAAETTFELLATQPEPRASLVIARPSTGRTHQIRRHAFRVGHPVLGDTEHGDTVENRWWREHRGLGRLALHCVSLDLGPRPSKPEERVSVAAPLPDDLRVVLEAETALWKTAVLEDPRLDLAPIDSREGSWGPRRRHREGEEAP